MALLLVILSGAHAPGQQVSQAYTLHIYGLGSDGIPPPPAPTATPQPVVRENRTAEDIICSLPWPCQEALNVAWCESRWDPNAYNRVSGASGLFQLLMAYHRWRLNGESEFDPAANARAAYSLWQERGWQPWIVGGCWPY